MDKITSDVRHKQWLDIIHACNANGLTRKAWCELHIPENRNASSATSEQRSAPNRMNNYNAIMMAGSYLVHSSPDDRSVQPVGG